MKVKIKIRQSLYEAVIADLNRPHEFAGERVGFLTAKIGNRDGNPLLVLLTDYISIPDDQYINDFEVGARINSTAIRSAMQHVLNTKEGVFHVHDHGRYGKPRYSKTDRREIPPMVLSIRNINRAAAHGILVLSRDKAISTVWTPNKDEPVEDAHISVIGHPLKFL
jgi:hypothetical protein